MKYIYLVLVFTIVLGAGCANIQGTTKGTEQTVMQKPVDETQDGALILYWAEGCSHCESVKAKIVNARADDKLNIIRKEAYDDEENMREFYTVAKYCQIPEYQMGVPMLWDGDKCYRGVEEIMDAIGDRMME